MNAQAHEVLVGSLSTEQRATIETEQVNTATAGRISPAGFLEPVREIETSRLATSLQTPAPVSFPRAQDDRYPLGYYRFFARDCRQLMRAWLAQELASFFDLCEPTRQTIEDDDRDATLVAEQLAAEEIRRPLNTNEIRLLGECVREIVTAKVVAADAERERTRELEREVL